MNGRTASKWHANVNGCASAIIGSCGYPVNAWSTDSGDRNILWRTLCEHCSFADSSPIRSGFGHNVNLQGHAAGSVVNQWFRKANKNLHLLDQRATLHRGTETIVNAQPQRTAFRRNPDSPYGASRRRHRYMLRRTKGESVRVSDSSPIRSRLVPTVNGRDFCLSLPLPDPICLRRRGLRCCDSIPRCSE